MGSNFVSRESVKNKVCFGRNIKSNWTKESLLMTSKLLKKREGQFDFLCSMKILQPETKETNWQLTTEFCRSVTKMQSFDLLGRRIVVLDYTKTCHPNGRHRRANTQGGEEPCWYEGVSTLHLLKDRIQHIHNESVASVHKKSSPYWT